MAAVGHVSKPLSTMASKNLTLIRHHICTSSLVSETMSHSSRSSPTILSCFMDVCSLLGDMGKIDVFI